MRMMPRTKSGRRLSSSLSVLPVLACLVLLGRERPPLGNAATGPSHLADDPSVDELMRAARTNFKRSDRRYEALVDEVEEAVLEAIAGATWRGGPGEGVEKPLREHPFFTLVDALADEARTVAGRKKNSEQTTALLTKYPWGSQLELLLGIAYGSDRPVPDHQNGFIDLGTAPAPPPGFPDLVTNLYLYGLGEIVGWQYRVKPGKRPKYEEREPKDRPLMATELPAWERLRIYLQGTLPEVPLFAIPQLTHRIHSRLAERRRAASGDPPHMDELLAFLDSKWNGFAFDIVDSKVRMTVVQPVHALFTDEAGFAFQFEPSRRLASVGDLPFISIQTFQQYAVVFRGERVGPGDFIGKTPAAIAVQGQFARESNYLARYRELVDVFVRAILAPDLRYPTYLANFDYPGGKVPEAREIDYAFDMPRLHALMVWAYVGKDPGALADFLYDHLLHKELNRFPSEVALTVQLTLLVRDMAPEMLQAIAARIAQGGGDYEREFSPHVTYRDAQGTAAPTYLAHSFHAFHRPRAELIREVARAVVLEEIGE